MKKILFNNWPVLVILALSGLIIWPLFLPGYFSHHDDLQVMRIFEMRKCLWDLQIPCRWVPDMGYGNGFPLFNYYGVFPYYIGAVLSFVTGYIGAAKALFLLPLVLGGVTMYFLGKELFGKSGGLVVGILYMFAPYRALDSYVRGAIDESFALAIVPLVFFLVLRLAKQSSLVNFLLLCLSFGSFLISHNIMTLFFVPVVLLWSVYCLYTEKASNRRLVFLSLIIGFGLASFFLIPAFFEKSLAQTDSLTTMDLNFRAHFVTVEQLFLSRFWGYGASTPGPFDTISFQIGWPHWWLAVATFVLVTVAFLRSGKSPELIVRVLLLILFAASIFMTHIRSAFIWEKIDILRFVQFPWRFLSLSIFSASLLGGSFVYLAKNTKLQYLLTCLIVIITVALNWNYFHPDKFYPTMTDREKLTGLQWETQQKAAILDYLPVTAVEPREKAPDRPLIRSGKAEISQFKNRSNFWSFKVNVTESAKIEVPVFDFPKWGVWVNGSKVSHSQNSVGRISFDLPSGGYEVTGKFQNTPLRTVSNLVSLLSILSLLVIPFYGKTRKFFV